MDPAPLVQIQLPLPNFAEVAQLAEQLSCKQQVPGPSPGFGSIFEIVAQLEEHRTFNPVVVGSTPTSLTNYEILYRNNRVLIYRDRARKPTDSAVG